MPVGQPNERSLRGNAAERGWRCCADECSAWGKGGRAHRSRGSHWKIRSLVKWGGVAATRVAGLAVEAARNPIFAS